MTVENCLLILEWHSIKIVDKIIGTRTWLFYGVDARVMTFAVRRVLCAKPGGLNLLLRVFRTTAKSCQMMWNLGSSTWSSCCLIFVNTCNEKNRCIQFLMYLMVWMLEFFCNSSKRIAFKIFIHALDWLLEFKILSVLAYKTFQNKDCNLAKNGWALKLEMDKNAMANGKFLAGKQQWLKIN